MHSTIISHRENKLFSGATSLPDVELNFNTVLLRASCLATDFNETPETRSKGIQRNEDLPPSLGLYTSRRRQAFSKTLRKGRRRDIVAWQGGKVNFLPCFHTVCLQEGYQAFSKTVGQGRGEVLQCGRVGRLIFYPDCYLSTLSS